MAAQLLTEKAAGLAANLVDGHAGRAVLARSAVTLATVLLLEHVTAHRVLYAALDREGAGAMQRIAAGLPLFGEGGAAP